VDIKNIIPIVILALALFVTASFAQSDDPDLYCGYLNKDVTALICFEDGQAYIQGKMVECTNETISIDEKCDPELGIVTVKKCCVYWIREGYDCYEFYR
jgi:type 1 fimbria pilin